jgi:hypothetical protein
MEVVEVVTYQSASKLRVAQRFLLFIGTSETGVCACISLFCVKCLLLSRTKHLYSVHYCLRSHTNMIATSTVRHRQNASVLYRLA